jgi:suppressor of ftsI
MAYTDGVKAVRVAVLLLGSCIIAYAVRPGTAASQAPIGSVAVANPPDVRPVNGVTSVTLTAKETPQRIASMVYAGAPVLPTLHVTPGGSLQVTYVNELSAHSTEKCARGSCMDMTNLHFHGLEVSPLAPQDDILTMLAHPGQTLRYNVQIPSNHIPGLFWFHTHPHGESAEQDLDGMSGAIVVDGIERYAPAVRGLPERVLVLRTQDARHDRPQSLRALQTRLNTPAQDCGTSGEEVSGFATVNGALRPAIAIAPGERQFWRIVNAQPEAFVDLMLDGVSLEVVAVDGEPLTYRDPARQTMTVSHMFLPPAGRVEAIVTGPAAGAHSTLRTVCVDTGPSGDINQGQVLADIVPSAPSPAPLPTVPASSQPPVYKDVRGVDAAKQEPPRFTVDFSEDKHGFYINGKQFTVDAAPMVTVQVGSYQHWRVVNEAHEMHPFHIHQLHFLAYAQNGRPLPDSVWQDTFNIPADATIDLVMDFTDPIIRGMSVFHCHILNHEDKGMMAKVLFK